MQLSLPKYLHFGNSRMYNPTSLLHKSGNCRKGKARRTAVPISPWSSSSRTTTPVGMLSMLDPWQISQLFNIPKVFNGNQSPWLRKAPRKSFFLKLLSWVFTTCFGTHMLGLKRDFNSFGCWLLYPSAQQEARKETPPLWGVSPSRKCALKTWIRLNCAAELHGELLQRLTELNQGSVHSAWPGRGGKYIYPAADVQMLSDLWENTWERQGHLGSCMVFVEFKESQPMS